MAEFSIKDFKEVLRNGPYAWPGGYPLFFVTSDCCVISIQAAYKNRKEIMRSIHLKTNDGWRVARAAVNYEDPNLVCDDTGEKIECAYCN